MPSRYLQRQACLFFGCSAADLGFVEEGEGREVAGLAELSIAEAYSQAVLSVVPLWLSRGWVELCESHVREGIKSAREEEESDVLPRLLCILADVLLQKECYEEARMACEEGLWRAELRGNEECRYEVLVRLSWVNVLCGQEVRAKHYLAQGWALAPLLEVEVSGLLKTQGVLACARRDYTEAKECLKQSLETAKKEEKGLLYGLLAQVESAWGNRVLAQEYFEEALKLGTNWFGARQLSLAHRLWFQFKARTDHAKDGKFFSEK